MVRSNGNGQRPEHREIEDVIFPELEHAEIRPSQNLTNAFAGAGVVKFNLNDMFYHLNTAVRKARQCSLTEALSQLRVAGNGQEAALRFIQETLKEEGPKLSARGSFRRPGPLARELYNAEHEAVRLLIEALQQECGCRIT